MRSSEFLTIYLHRQLGMDESLFQRLALHRPESTVQLSLQYRMNSTIMRISNALVYEGKLQCGNETIAKAMLSLPNWGSLQQVLTIIFHKKVIYTNSYTLRTLRTCCSQSKFRILKIHKSSVCAHYFCKIKLRTSRAVLTRAWASRRVDLCECRVDSFSKRIIIFCW